MTGLREPRAESLLVTEESLVVDLVDGRTISVPLAWYPRLLHGTPGERKRWQLIGNGEGIHWPELDEDLSELSEERPDYVVRDAPRGME